MRTPALALLLLATTALPPLHAAVQVRLETQLYVFNQARIHTVKIGDEPLADTATAVISPGVIHFDDATLTLTNGSYAWSDGTAPSPMTRADVPKLITPLDKSASFMGLMPTQYFEPTPGGMFALKETAASETPRWKLTFRVGSAADSQRLAVQCQVEWAAITRREKIPGVDLDVGKPVVTLAKNDVTFAARPGDWSALLFKAPKTADYGALLLVRITAVSPPVTKGQSSSKAASMRSVSRQRSDDIIFDQTAFVSHLPRKPIVAFAARAAFEKSPSRR